MKLAIIKTIYCKELLDTLRDKRTLGVMILLPVLLYPLLLIGGGSVMARQVVKTRERTARVALADHDSSALRTVLQADRKLQVVAVKDARASLRQRALDVAVAVPPNCDEVLAHGGRVKLILLYDGAREESLTASARVMEALHSFEEVILIDRLTHQGLAPDFADPLQTETQNLASAERMGGFLLGPLLPFMITVIGLLGAFYPAIDLTAGEKERGTLETLLTTPASRSEIVVGKFLTVCTVAFITVLLHFGSLALTVTQGLGLMGLQGQIDLTLPLPVILATGLLMLPTTVFFSAGMMAVAVFARSFKEAQNYLSPLYTIAMMPAGIAFLPGVKLNYSLALLPVAGPALLVKQLAVGSLDWRLGSVVLLATCCYAGLALGLAMVLFAREEVVLAETDLLNWRALQASLRRGHPEGPSAGEALGLFIGVVLLIYSLGAGVLQRYLTAGLILTQLLFILTPTLLFLLLRGYDLGTTLRLRWPGARPFLAAVCAALGGALLTVEATTLENLILPLSKGFKMPTQRLLAEVAGPGLPAVLLMGAVFVGVCEEILFRGVILVGMRRSWRPPVAILLTALLFGLFPLTPYPLLTTTLLGLLLGYLAWRSGSLWCSMVAHISVNCLTLGLAFPSSSATEPLPPLQLPPALLLAGVLLCVGGVVRLHFLSARYDPTEITEPLNGPTQGTSSSPSR